MFHKLTRWWRWRRITKNRRKLQSLSPGELKERIDNLWPNETPPFVNMIDDLIPESHKQDPVFRFWKEYGDEGKSNLISTNWLFNIHKRLSESPSIPETLKKKK